MNALAIYNPSLSANRARSKSKAKRNSSSKRQASTESQTEQQMLHRKSDFIDVEFEELVLDMMDEDIEHPGYRRALSPSVLKKKVYVDYYL